jgi:2-haloacid dehalogenase
MTGSMPAPRRRFDGVLFDLLTALLDSWTLWNALAGSEASGRRWRSEYLKRTCRAGAYRPYEVLVSEAAEAVGLPRHAADTLADRYGELQPWPDVRPVLGQLAAAGLRLGVVTNCSEALGRIAAGCVGIALDAAVSAERAGC